MNRRDLRDGIVAFDALRDVRPGEASDRLMPSGCCCCMCSVALRVIGLGHTMTRSCPSGSHGISMHSGERRCR